MIGRFILAHLRWFLLGAALIVAGVWLYNTWTAKPKAEAKLGKNQTGAAIESGSDAVNTVGARGKAETDLDRKVNDANDKVGRATDAAGADAAGRDGLCSVSRDLCGE